MKKIILLVVSASLVFGFFWSKKTYDINQTKKNKKYFFIDKKTKKLINGFIKYPKRYITNKENSRQRIIEVEDGKLMSEKLYRNEKLKTFIKYTKKGGIKKIENYE
jgi:hypothetical protein